MNDDRSSSKSCRGDRTKTQASGGRPTPRKGRPGRLFEIDFKTIEKMPRNSPDQIREIARAYVKGNELGFDACVVARTLQKAINHDAFDRSSQVEAKLLDAWKKAGGIVVNHCAKHPAKLTSFLEAVTEAMRLNSDPGALDSNRSRHRFSVVASAYAKVWQGLIAEGKKRRPSTVDVRNELARGRSILKTSGLNDEAVAELDAILGGAKNLSKYTSNLFA